MSNIIDHVDQVDEKMTIDVVDDNDVPIGSIERSRVFREKVSFRVIHNLIFNSRGELLIQQLAKSRKRHPGFWGSSVAAYLFTGESYRAAAQRRLAEELGLRQVSLQYLGKMVMEDEGCRKFISIFTAKHDGPFTFDHSHIESLEFLAPVLIRQMHLADSRQFTPTFLRVLSYYESRI
jgi:isopentenyl-diphosphate delta-isomerase